MKTATSIESRGFTRFRTVFLIIFGLVCLAPIAWMLLASVKTNIDIYDPASTFSFTPTLQNYVSVFAQADFLQFFINSLVIGVGSTAEEVRAARPELEPTRCSGSGW